MKIGNRSIGPNKLLNHCPDWN